MIDNMLGRVFDEIAKAEVRYGPFRSTHEGVGVLLEEVDELRTEVHANNLDAVADEAIQVAAVALRIVGSLGSAETRERSTK